jgi:N-acetylmuramoyl-L-alanine amidase
VLDIVFPDDFGIKKIYLDAGHGSKGNPGNSGCFCQQEEIFTLGVSNRLAKDLAATGHFEIKKSRQGNEQTDYKTRVADASEWADAFVSIHSDVRGPYDTWQPQPDTSCNVNTGFHGFTVLWSQEGDDPLKSRRQALADALSNRMVEAGFHPYDGVEYENLYEGDPQVPGSFVDVHEPSKRIMVLRRPTIPSVIIETHQALDRDDVARWGEEATRSAFSAAVTAGLVDAL